MSAKKNLFLAPSPKLGPWEDVDGRNPFRTTVQKPWCLIRFSGKYQHKKQGFPHGFKVMTAFVRFRRISLDHPRCGSK